MEIIIAIELGILVVARIVDLAVTISVKRHSQVQRHFHVPRSSEKINQFVIPKGYIAYGIKDQWVIKPENPDEEIVS